MRHDLAEPVLLDVADAVARLTLNRPDSGNAIDAGFGRSFRAHAEALVGRNDVRAVLLTGAGATFCVGGDLAYFAATDDAGAALYSLATDLHAGIAALASIDAPVIAAVQGAAAGAGLSLVAGADLVVAADDAKLTMAYTAVGLSPDGGATWFLPRLIGTRRTAELALTNRRLSAAEALDWGIVNQVVPADELMATAEALTTQIAAGATSAFGRVKRLLAASSTTSLTEQLAAEAEGIAACAAGPDGAEGIAAFLDKRRPTFGADLPLYDQPTYEQTLEADSFGRGAGA
jgi:2-(1,2-epoxy-1,2-dihydrophenyl)acetyl-CoA isomerase